MACKGAGVFSLMSSEVTALVIVLLMLQHLFLLCCPYFLSYLIYPVVWLTVGAPLYILQPASSTPRGSQLFRSMMFHSRPVHSLMLSSHRFLCLPLRLPPCTAACMIVLASPDDRVTCSYHLSLRLFTEVRRSSYGPMAFPVLAFTSSLVM